MGLPLCQYVCAVLYPNQPSISHDGSFCRHWEATLAPPTCPACTQRSRGLRTTWPTTSTSTTTGRVAEETTTPTRKRATKRTKKSNCWSLNFKLQLLEGHNITLAVSNLMGLNTSTYYSYFKKVFKLYNCNIHHYQRHLEFYPFGKCDVVRMRTLLYFTNKANIPPTNYRC